MSWILVIILAYFFFSLASLGDKLVLSRSQSPKMYTFYVGVLSLLIALLIPFVGLSVPSPKDFFWIILTSLTFILGIYVLYSTVQMFEVSRVVPIIGSVQPIFILILSWIFLGSFAEKLNILAFLILLLGSCLISFEKKPELTKKLLRLSMTTSFLIALGFVLMKKVFLGQTFFNAVIWLGMFNFLIALLLLLDKSFRSEMFNKKSVFDKKTISLVLVTQSAGGFAGFLQSLAIFLAPAGSLAILNALRGIQYSFLFFLTLIFSVFFPKVLREEVSKSVIIQKGISIFLIIVGLAILVIQ